MKHVAKLIRNGFLLGLVWLLPGFALAIEVTSGTVVVESEKNIKKLQRLGVPQYNISFAIEDGKIAVAETQKEGKFGKAKATASAYARITGLQPQTMQSIVDEAYADFVSKLEAAGFEVDAEAFAKTQGNQYVTFHPGPVNNYSYYRVFNNKLNDVTVAPTGMKVLKSQPNTLGLPAGELGLTLLNVQYLLHFGYFGAETKAREETFGSGASAEARVTLGQGLQVYWHSGINVVNGLENAFKKPNAKVLVNNNFYSTVPFGHTTKDGASGGRKGLMGAVTAGLIGGQRYVIAVNEGEYAAVAQAVLQEVNSALVAELAAKR